MEQVLVKTFWVGFLIIAWLNLGGSAVLAPKADRDEHGSTWGGAIYLTLGHALRDRDDLFRAHGSLVQDVVSVIRHSGQ
jgi:hypothetical protein